MKNKVKFVTFNYDTSLEFQLRTALNSIDIFDPGDVDEFLDDDRIVHMYGSVDSATLATQDVIDLQVSRSLGHTFGQPLNFADDFETRKQLLDRFFQSSLGIKTIDPDGKDHNAETSLRVSNWINDADIIYILGYGFDENNSRRLSLDKISRIPKSTTAVMFTNFDNLNVVSKRASKLFFGSAQNHFEKQTVHGTPFTNFYVEKSSRSVYEALEKDFDALEL